eukprot:7089820-Ditylum_brightwellii.AAC.1
MDQQDGPGAAAYPPGNTYAREPADDGGSIEYSLHEFVRKSSPPRIRGMSNSPPRSRNMNRMGGVYAQVDERQSSPALRGAMGAIERKPSTSSISRSRSGRRSPTKGHFVGSAVVPQREPQRMAAPIRGREGPYGEVYPMPEGPLSISRSLSMDQIPYDQDQTLMTPFPMTRTNTSPPSQMLDSGGAYERESPPGHGMPIRSMSASRIGRRSIGRMAEEGAYAVSSGRSGAMHYDSNGPPDYEEDEQLSHHSMSRIRSRGSERPTMYDKQSSWSYEEGGADYFPRSNRERRNPTAVDFTPAHDPTLNDRIDSPHNADNRSVHSRTSRTSRASVHSRSSRARRFADEQRDLAVDFTPDYDPAADMLMTSPHNADNRSVHSRTSRASVHSRSRVSPYTDQRDLAVDFTPEYDPLANLRMASQHAGDRSVHSRTSRASVHSRSSRARRYAELYEA